MRFVILLSILLGSCGQPAQSQQAGNAAGAKAVIIQSPDNSTCYGIIDGNGNLIGGNCK